MSKPNLWNRLRSARIVQVLVVYLGASWAVLQIADVLAEALSLPEWVLPVAVLLLLIGLIVILATAWVQSLPSTTAREEAGEIPTDWQVAPAEALASLRAGKLPHLTWGRAILGGVVALSLLFGGAGLYMGLTGRTLALGPTEVGADQPGEGIAVVPFEVRGQDLDIWREGMVDLLSNNMDGVGGFRTVDPRTVMARWKEGIGDDASPDLTATLRAAFATGARYALLGSVVGIGSDVRLVSTVYDLDTRDEIARGQAEGPAADVLRLADDLAVGTIRSLLRNTGRQGESDLTAETLTTESLPALREYLEGARHYRRGEFAEAVQGFERAVAEDSTFAIALVRLSEAYGWLEDMSSERMREFGVRAMAHADRLPPRYRFMIVAWDALNNGSAEGLPIVRQAVQKYPDDPEAWFLLAETLIHMPVQTFATDEEIVQALDRAATLDPGFAPYLVHVADFAIVRGDRPAAEEAIARYEALAGNDRAIASTKLAVPILLGDSAEAVAALETIRNAPPRDVDIMLGTYTGWTDRFDRLEWVDLVWAESSGANRNAAIVWKRVSQGALRSASDLAERGQLSASNLGVYFGHQFELWGVAPGDDFASQFTASLCEEPYNATCSMFLAVALAGDERRNDLGSVARSTREAARASEAAGDSAVAVGRFAAAEIMDALGAWRRGDLAAARRGLTAHTSRGGVFGERALLALAEIELTEGRWDQAVHFAQGLVHSHARPLALYIQAKAHEGRGDTAKAREAWRHFVTVTRLGDDDVPRVREGREALARLGG
jgi:tetratricopeptide (TPR) repeat protein